MQYVICVIVQLRSASLCDWPTRGQRPAAAPKTFDHLPASAGSAFRANSSWVMLSWHFHGVSHGYSRASDASGPPRMLERGVRLLTPYTPTPPCSLSASGTRANTSAEPIHAGQGTNNFSMTCLVCMGSALVLAQVPPARQQNRVE